VFFGGLLQRLQNAPGINAAAITTKLPMQGGMNGYIEIPGQQEEAMTGPLVENTGISGDYFRVMGVPLLEGREFNAADHELVAKYMHEVVPIKDDKLAQAVADKYVLPAIINKTMAKTFWPNQKPIGKIFKAYTPFRVVGVVGDVKQQELRSAAMPESYYPLEWEINEPNYPISVVVQSAGAPESATATVRSAVQSIDNTLALMSVRTMPQILSEAVNDTRYETWLLGGAALLALILAAVGTYGVMSYVVGQRTNEIGIRMALGAGQRQIVGMVLRQAGVLVGIGVMLGLIGAAGGARLMQGLLVGVKPFDLATYGSVAALLGVVALAACYLPVRRAMNVDPMIALRDE
jgi:predicted permease